MRLLELPHWLDTWGLDFDVLEGWEERGEEFAVAPRVVVGHHTATRADAPGDLPTWRILRDGRPDLAGPLAQVGLGRSGRVLLVASGKANHAGRGTWRGLPGGLEYDVRVSARTVGIEAEHPGDGSHWPHAQVDAYDRLIACLLWGLGETHEAYCGHREWALPVGRKPDPRGIDLPDQRERVRQLLLTGPPRPQLPAPDVPIVEVPVPRVAELRIHTQGKWVRKLQGLLVAHGHKIDVDGRFGPKTELALNRHKTAHGLLNPNVADKAAWINLMEK